jgi:hypothetical protein
LALEIAPTRGRAKIDREIRDLIRRMSKENTVVGSAADPGFNFVVACGMSRGAGPPSQGWKTFLRNHAAGISSIDLFVVRTISFKLLSWSGRKGLGSASRTYRDLFALHIRPAVVLPGRLG